MAITTFFRSLKEIQGHAVRAIDGDIGKVHEFYFDDEFWILRYLVVDMGHWLPGRKVLIPPASFKEMDWGGKEFRVDLTREAVEKSPDIDVAKPVSRQHEIKLRQYFQWPPYWEMTAVGSLVVPVPAAPTGPVPGPGTKREDPHLRNTREVLGYRVHALDGEVGIVDDFLVNDADWVIQYIVVRLDDAALGKKVLICPLWVDQVRWNESVMAVHIPRAAIKKSPPYDDPAATNRDYESRLYEYYGKPKYWS